MFCLTSSSTMLPECVFLIYKPGPLLFTCLKWFSDAPSFSGWDSGSTRQHTNHLVHQMFCLIWSLVTFTASSLTRLARSHWHRAKSLDAATIFTILQLVLLWCLWKLCLFFLGSLYAPSTWKHWHKLFQTHLKLLCPFAINPSLPPQN